MFIKGNELSFVSVILSCFIIEYFIEKAKNGEKIYMRPISGINAMEEGVGRATEMGKSVLFVPGISGLDQIDTIAGLTIASLNGGALLIEVTYSWPGIALSLQEAINQRDYPVVQGIVVIIAALVVLVGLLVDLLIAAIDPRVKF